MGFVGGPAVGASASGAPPGMAAVAEVGVASGDEGGVEVGCEGEAFPAVGGDGLRGGPGLTARVLVGGSAGDRFQERAFLSRPAGCPDGRATFPLVGVVGVLAGPAVASGAPP